MSPTYAELDVAATRLLVRVHPIGARWSLPNDAAGIESVVDRLRREAPALIVVDAAVGHARPVVGALVAAGLPVAMIDLREEARRVAAIAAALGARARQRRLRDQSQSL